MGHCPRADGNHLLSASWLSGTGEPPGPQRSQWSSERMRRVPQSATRCPLSSTKWPSSASSQINESTACPITYTFWEELLTFSAWLHWLTFAQGGA